MHEAIHIYHTNDIHSHLDSWPRTRTFLQTRKALHKEVGDSSYILDIGDFIDRSNIFTEASLGKNNIPLLNEAQYDAITIGNNEGITLSKEMLNHLYDEKQFDVVVCNLKNEDHTTPDWAVNHQIYETTKGTKIGLIAATAPYPDFYHQLGWQIEEPFAALARELALIQNEVDVILCLSHLGKPNDLILAEKFPQIDVIFGSHTHHIFHEGEIENGVLMTGGGKYGVFIGHTQLMVDSDMKKVVQKKTTLYRTNQLPAPQNEQIEIEMLHEKGIEQLSVEVFESKRFYNKEWYHYSRLSKLFSEALLDFSKADCAFFNAGIFLTDLQRGKITAYDIHQMLPHPINACVLQLTGQQLKDVWQTIQNEQSWPRKELKGLGFRGTVVGKLLTYDFFVNEKNELYVKNKLINDLDIVSVVTLDMFTFGWFFPQFKKIKKNYLLPHFLRDILTSYGYKYF